MNIIFSYSAKEDFELAEEGHTFLGAGQDQSANEVHVFLKKGEKIATPSSVRFIKEDE